MSTLRKANARGMGRDKGRGKGKDRRRVALLVWVLGQPREEVFHDAGLTGPN